MADTYLLDTCILPQYFNRDPDNVVDEKTRRFRQRIREVEDSNVTICTVTLGEVEYGLRAAKLKAVAVPIRFRRLGGYCRSLLRAGQGRCIPALRTEGEEAEEARANLHR